MLLTKQRREQRPDEAPGGDDASSRHEVACRRAEFVSQGVTSKGSTLIYFKPLHLLATPARGEESACISALANVIAPRSVGVAWKDAPTLE